MVLSPALLRNEEKENTVAKAVKLMSEAPMRPAFSEYICSEAVSLKGFLRGRRAGLKTNYSDRLPSLKESRIRLLFVEGEDDIFINKDVIKKVASSVDTAEVSVVEGCRHSPHFQEPEKFNALVGEFIARGLKDKEEFE